MQLSACVCAPWYWWRLRCLYGSSYVRETVGAKMSHSLSSSVSSVSSHSKAGNSSHIWMQWFIWQERRLHIWCLGAPETECSTSLLLVSVPLMGVPLMRVPPYVVPSLLWSDAAAWWQEADGGFLALVLLEWEAEVLQSEVGEARPNGMCLMLGSAVHQPSKSGSLQSWQLNARSFSYESEGLVNNWAEILVLHVGRRRSMCVCTCVGPPLAYLLHKHETKEGKNTRTSFISGPKQWRKELKTWKFE